MKTKQTNFNPEADAVLSYVPDFQTTPLTITGIGESLLPIVEAVEQTFAAQTAQHAATAGKAATQAVRTSSEVLDGRHASIAARLYDLAHGTDMYGLLKQKREDERNLNMAQRLGLITTDRCAKHERVLAQLKRIV